MAMANKNVLQQYGTADSPMLTRQFRIVRKKKETYDTFTIDLNASDNSSAFDFTPGQFNMLYVYGIGEVPISISGSPEKPETLTHTIRKVGAVTNALGKMQKDDTVGVRGPYGVGWPINEAVGNDVVIIAGGIGLAPLRPAIYHVLAHREKYDKFILMYGARTPEDILYAKRLSKWQSLPEITTLVTVDRATGNWLGNVGVVTTLVGRKSFDPNRCIAMICGPEIMMRYSVMALEKYGVNEDKIYVSMERNMKCGVGLCGHCQIGPTFVCKDGPVYRYDRIRNQFIKREM
jgi:NAD(P)H-flavin reductase